jgi:hypothetical protein
MRFCCQRLHIDRNTPSRFKSILDFLNITDFLVITDIPDFLFLPVFDMFGDEIEG